MYTEKERREDFNYFIKHYQELYNKYGHKFIAINVNFLQTGNSSSKYYCF